MRHPQCQCLLWLRKQASKGRAFQQDYGGGPAESLALPPFLGNAMVTKTLPKPYQSVPPSTNSEPYYSLKLLNLYQPIQLRPNAPKDLNGSFKAATRVRIPYET